MSYRRTLYASHSNFAEERSLSVSVVVPAYNEAGLLAQNLGQIYEYLLSHRDRCVWDMVVVDDGSLNETGAIADAFAESRSNVWVSPSCQSRTWASFTHWVRSSNRGLRDYAGCRFELRSVSR
jgi:glycosyltransferase involved in cell wall biosynthesis